MAVDGLRFRSKLWRYPGDRAAWYFLTIDQTKISEIKERFSPVKRGWGTIPVETTIGKTAWKTSIFPDKDGSYILPVKAAVRKAERLAEDDVVNFSLRVLE